MLTLAPAQLRTAVQAAYDAGFFETPKPEPVDDRGFMRIPRWAKMRFEELTGFYPSDDMIYWLWDNPLRAPVIPTNMGRDEGFNRKVTELALFLWQSFVRALGAPVIDWTEVQ